MKKILIGALMSVMLMSFGAFTEASDVEQENICCRGYCYQDCDDQSGEYCGRYGCGQGQGNGYRGGR
ncbi:MAG: hypothetical protein IKI76_04730 [Selenomonadaceae bacterium]|nr:hypothetical protein [Selenomonadaceae bacterium]